MLRGLIIEVGGTSPYISLKKSTLYNQLQSLKHDCLHLAEGLIRCMHRIVAHRRVHYRSHCLGATATCTEVRGFETVHGKYAVGRNRQQYLDTP